MKAIVKHRNSHGVMTVWLSLLWIAAVPAVVTSARADIYFWEDDNGVIHFSNQAVPLKATLYMSEPAVSEPTEPAMESQSIDRQTDDLERDRRQADTQARLDEANRKLSSATERIEELTASVSRSKAQAAEAARSAVLEAENARHYQNEGQERIIVHTVPHRKHTPHGHRIRKHGANQHQLYGKGSRHFRHFKHNSKFVPYYNNGKRSRLYKHYRNQDHPGYNIIPTPILPPGRSRIPKAYGVR